MITLTLISVQTHPPVWIVSSNTAANTPEFGWIFPRKTTSPWLGHGDVASCWMILFLFFCNRYVPYTRYTWDELTPVTEALYHWVPLRLLVHWLVIYIYIYKYDQNPINICELDHNCMDFCSGISHPSPLTKKAPQVRRCPIHRAVPLAERSPRHWTPGSSLAAGDVLRFIVQKVGLKRFKTSTVMARNTSYKF